MSLSAFLNQISPYGCGIVSEVRGPKDTISPVDIATWRPASNDVEIEKRHKDEEYKIKSLSTEFGVAV